MHLNSDSITNDFCVEVNLIGSELDPDRVTSITGLEPVKAARAGDTRTFGKENSVYEHGFWAYEVSSTDEITECRDHQLICLARSIEPHIDQLRDAGVERVYFYFTLSSVVGLLNIRFKSETLQTIARLDADLYVSCYDCFNPKHPLWSESSLAAEASADGSVA
jgi:hypothetical protein